MSTVTVRLPDEYALTMPSTQLLGEDEEATRTLFHVLKGLAAAWSGDLEAAAAELQWCDAWQARDGRATWRNAPRTRPTQGLRRLDALSERLANRSKRSVRAVRPETAHRADQ